MDPSELDEARVFVGADRSQLLAVKVLEYSIRRRTHMSVTVRSMHDLDLPEPNDIRQRKRTGFSFTRFAIPRLAGHQGRALYLDADMLVLRDLKEVYLLPFEGAKVLLQGDPSAGEPGASVAGKKRVRQCSVMLLDCGALDWEPEDIIAGLDGAYSYEELMVQLCILDPAEIREVIPFEWNSLETYEPGRTGLIHYTDMNTQPWVYPGNRNGWLWLSEVRSMLEEGAMTWDELRDEVELGYFRPSLIPELETSALDGPPDPAFVEAALATDARGGFKMHAEVYEQQRRRLAALAALDGPAAVNNSLARFGKRAAAALLRKLTAQA